QSLQPNYDDEEGEHGRIVTQIIRRYEQVLDFSFRNRAIVVAISLGIVLISIGLYHKLGSEFLPAFDEGAFVLDYFPPPGSSLEETDRILKHVEAMLKESPDVES